MATKVVEFSTGIRIGKNGEVDKGSVKARKAERKREAMKLRKQGYKTNYDMKVVLVPQLKFTKKAA